MRVGPIVTPDAAVELHMTPDGVSVTSLADAPFELLLEVPGDEVRLPAGAGVTRYATRLAPGETFAP